MTRWRNTIGLLVMSLLFGGVARAELEVEPVLDSDLLLAARSATLARQDGAVLLLLLEGDVSVTAGLQEFVSKQAVVRLTRRPGLGKPVWDAAFYFDRVGAGGEGGVRADGAGMLVTVATRGQVQFKLDIEAPIQAKELPDSKLTRAAMARLEEYDRRMNRALLDVVPGEPFTPEQLALRERRRLAIEQERRRIVPPDPDAQPVDDELVEQPILPRRGTVRYAKVGRVVYQTGREKDEEDAILLLGGVKVMYQDAEEGRDFILEAEKIVIFIDKDADPTAGARRQIDAGIIRGIYLEDAASIRLEDPTNLEEGSMTVRAPRAFYDLTSNRAILLDAVVYSVGTRQRVPLYMRADEIRQTSATSFSAKDALFTTSEFGKPHLSIGASKLTLDLEEQNDGTTEQWVTADGLTLRAGDTPFFYWPTAMVEAGSIPLRKVQVGYESENGADLQTSWDMFSLTGTRAPKGVDLLGNIDYRGEHGMGLGLELDYDREVSEGFLDGYFLPNDSGTDEIANRSNINFSGETRGFVRGRHEQRLPAGWEVWLEGSYVSDPTLLEELFPEEAYSARPYETSAYFKKAEDDWALTALLKGETNYFTPQLAPLLTPGYTVEKLPEAEYRQTTSLLNDRVTMFHESRIGRMRAAFGSDSPADRGFTAAQSAAAFGIAPTTSYLAAARAAGFPTTTVSRLDTRTEFTLPLRAGIFDLTPFLVGRFTGYDDGFAAFNGGNDEQVRFSGGGGIKLSTQFSRVNDQFNSTLFDVQGIRHIIEPGITLAYYDNSVDASDLPVYDPGVERINEGGIMRIGMVNTWQTRRGGPGRSRSVDWIKLRTDVVLNSEDASNPDALPRYYDYRPEYALGDDHFYAELMWAVTEATAITGELTHNFDDGTVVQWRTGIENEHSDRLSTFINYREIDALNARLLGYGAQLKLTSKYRAGIYQVIDFGRGESRTINLTLDRRIPRANLGLAVGYDSIDGEATIAIVFTPQGGDDDRFDRTGKYGVR